MVNVIIAGSRTFKNEKYLHECCNKILYDSTVGEWEYPICVYCGMAAGADMLGYDYAKCSGLPVKEFLADWERYGRKAGIVRNMKMAETAHMLIAFWDGKSKGTKHMIDHGIFVGLEVHLFRVDKI